MINRKEKLLTFRYYFYSNKCICGNNKKKERWICLKCRELVINTKEMLELDKACENHCISAQKVLNLIEKP